MNKFELVIGGVNPITLVKTIVEWSKKGAELKEDTYPMVSGIPFRVVMVIDTDEQLESDSVTIVKPIIFNYTKEQLEELSWDSFKKELRKVGITGRDRAVMTNKYLSQ